MRNLSDVNSKGHFFQGGNSPLKYFQDCLEVSVQYRRAAGYFSSSMFLAADASLTNFFENGGLMRIVCSPRLMPEDVEAIAKGSASRLIISNSLERDLQEVLNTREDSCAAKILGLLVERGQIEFKIAVKKSAGAGIFHSKVGIFEDFLGERSAFCGSTNETWSGWADYGNSESFVSMNTYSGPESLVYVESLDRYFESLWNDQLENLEVRPLPEIPAEILRQESKGYKLEELVEDLRRVKEKSIRQKAINPQAKSLMEHQKMVLESWRKNQFIGIVDHVTGAGKTITALAAIKGWLQEEKPVLVIVPSTLLQKQWAFEIRNDIGIEPLFVGGELGKRQRWLSVLADATRRDKMFGKRITLAVLGSASSEDFVKRVQFGVHLLVVGDEVHTIGQVQSTKLADGISQCGGRLGLSATYERFGDEEGTKRIERSFGFPLLPKFTIRDAIAAGRLVPYEYHIAECRLDDLEQELFDQLTKDIQQLLARERTNSFNQLSPYLQLLIFKRAKIIKKASQKTAIAFDVISDNYKQGDRWLVYCDDIDQVETIANSLKELDIHVLKYFDAMVGDKEKTLEYFGEKGGVLIAIKCLDEGIDIPSATHALILASSQNPREYIQRRGRVLRSNPNSGKYKASIYDVVTVRDNSVPLIRSEVSRMAAFAQDANNSLILLQVEEYLSAIALHEGNLTDFIYESTIAQEDDTD